jgi:ParB family chromosome partitioning protein
MAKDRRDVLALHIAHDPALALDLAIFSLARSAGHFGYSPVAPSASLTATSPRA